MIDQTLAQKPNPRAARRIRESRLLEREDVARETGLTLRKIEEIENNGDALTRGILKTLAKHYAVPPYFFYIENLALPRLEMPDFRSAQTTGAKLHDNLAASLERANEIRDVVAEGWEYLGDSAIQWQKLPSLYSDGNIKESADKLREFLLLDEKPASSFQTTKLYIDWIRAKSETSGLITIFESLGDRDGRGYCIAHDNGIPFVSLNTLNQGPEARLFTLTHELVHVSLRSSGVSDPFATRNRIERFCNRVAAETLMPEVLFFAEAQRFDHLKSDNQFVRCIAEQFKVSQQAVALRVDETNVRSGGFYRRWMSQFTDGDYHHQVNLPQEKLIRISKDEGKKKIAKYGTTLPIILYKLFERGFLSALDVTRVSGIKRKYLEVTYESAVQRLRELGLNGR